MTTFTIYETDTNYSEIPTGQFEDLNGFLREHDLEVIERTSQTAVVRAEWGNGEGYDTFTVEIVEADPLPEFESEAGYGCIYMPTGYKAKAEYLATSLNLRDNRGNPSISMLFRTWIDAEMGKYE